MGPRSGRVGKRLMLLGSRLADRRRCDHLVYLSGKMLPRRGLEERIPFHSSNFLLFPLGAGSSGVCEYVTVRVTTWRTETLLVLLDSGSVGE